MFAWLTGFRHKKMSKDERDEMLRRARRTHEFVLSADKKFKDAMNRPEDPADEAQKRPADTVRRTF